MRQEKREILDQKLRYERYTYDAYTSTYYFKGDDLSLCQRGYTRLKDGSDEV